MKPTQSIISGHVAHQLIVLTDHDDVASIECVGIHWTLRRCMMSKGMWHGVTRRVHHIRSGGIVITARLLKRFEHAPACTTGSMTVRVRFPWSDATVSRAVHRVHRTLASWAILAEERERVYARWEPIRMAGHVDMDAEVSAGETCGHTAEYERMTTEDCEWWLARADQIMGGSA